MLDEEMQNHIVQTARDICDIVHKDQDILFTLDEICDVLEEIYEMGNSASIEDYEDGKSEGYEDGYEDGYERGNQDGYEEGFKDGVKSMSDEEDGDEQCHE